MTFEATGFPPEILREVSVTKLSLTGFKVGCWLLLWYVDRCILNLLRVSFSFWFIYMLFFIEDFHCKLMSAIPCRRCDICSREEHMSYAVQLYTPITQQLLCPWGLQKYIVGAFPVDKFDRVGLLPNHMMWLLDSATRSEMPPFPASSCFSKQPCTHGVF